jgi:hypothetical protein
VSENLRVGSRGRAAPKIGQERVYRAQQINESGPFLRLPLGALRALKGDALSVSLKKIGLRLLSVRDLKSFLKPLKGANQKPSC